MQKEEEASVRFPDFQIFATLFSPLLSLRLSRLLVVFSPFSKNCASPISHPIVFLARAALLGFQTRERDKERRNKSSVAIINTNNNNKV